MYRLQLPATAIPFPLNRLINAAPQPVTGPVPDPDRSTPEQRGRYLVTMAACEDCHTPTDPQGQPIPGLGILPWRMEATADLRNLLAEGYLSLGQQVMLVETPRSFRGGLSFIF